MVSKKYSKGFTLIELLVVISIISLIAAVILASLSVARDKARIAAGQKFDGYTYRTLGSEIVGYWSLNETSGATAYDVANNGNGTRFGTVPSVNGAVGKAASFNGNSANYISVPNNESIQTTGNQTISFWVYPVSFGVRRNPVAKAYGGEGSITQEISGALNYYYGTAGTDNTPYQGFGMTSPIELNKWTHLAVVRDLTNMRLYWYKNGVLVNQATALYAPAGASTANLLIGRGYAGTYDGYIDEVKIYGQALGLAQIEKLYAEGLEKKKYADSTTP
jgi:prepilin-type N-terminal cleavage/methylation domain-containing protein